MPQLPVQPAPGLSHAHLRRLVTPTKGTRRRATAEEQKREAYALLALQELEEHRTPFAPGDGDPAALEGIAAGKFSPSSGSPSPAASPARA